MERMEACTARCVSNLPLNQPRDLVPKHIQSIHGKTRFPFIGKQVGFSSGLRYCPNSSLRSITSQATSSETTPYDKDEPDTDGVITLEDNLSDDKKEDYDTKLNEAAQDGSFIDNPLQLFKLLEEFDIKFDYEETYPILVFGGGGAVALWLAAAVLGAIDSIPLLPKLLEVIGLGYTVWFNSRYLIFKENRDELFARVEHIKQEVLGSKDD